jgi:hypothetical protein
MSDFLLTAIVFAVILPTVNYWWRRSAIRQVKEWMHARGIDIADDGATKVSTIDRPAWVSINGVEDGTRYRYAFELHSGFLSLPMPPSDVYGKV